MKVSSTARRARGSCITPTTRLRRDLRPIPPPPPPLAIQPLRPPVKINRKTQTSQVRGPDPLVPTKEGQGQQKCCIAMRPSGPEASGAKAKIISRLYVGAESPSHKKSESRSAIVGMRFRSAPVGKGSARSKL